MWIDLDRKIHIIMLSNRVHPHRKNVKISAFRPVLHNAIMKTLLDAERAVMSPGIATLAAASDSAGRPGTQDEDAAAVASVAS